MNSSINGRTKGASFERNIAKQLTTWSGQPFDRVFRSGGGIAKGDIAPAYGSWPFVAELKNRESWNHSDLWKGKGATWKWWDKVQEEANNANKHPMLILKKNRHDSLVCITLQSLKSLPNFTDLATYPISSFMVVNEIIIMSLDSFLWANDGTKIVTP